MNYLIDKQISRPAYIQLYELLRKDIVEKVYPYGSKLPSKRVIAESLGISLITTQHSLELLIDEGYIESRERSGYFVTYREDDIFPTVSSDTMSAPPAPHQHEQNENDFPFSVLAKTMRRVISDYGEDILEKTENNGSFVLRKAICDYLARSRGIKTDPECIVIGSGAEYLYGLIVRLVGRDVKYAIESPSYEKIAKVYTAEGLNIDYLMLGNDGIRSAELNRTDAKVLHISPYRSFPSGVTASASKRQQYLRWAKEKNGIIIEDDFDSEFTLSKKPAPTVFSLSSSGKVIYMNTFTKTICPAIRVAYMVLPENLLGLFKEKVGFYSCTVPSFEQYVLAEFINDGDFERHINRVRRNNRKKIK